MPQDERRHAVGRRDEDFEGPTLRVLVAHHDAVITHMRHQIASLQRDVARVLAHLTTDQQIEGATLREKVLNMEEALRELLG